MPVKGTEWDSQGDLATHQRAGQSDPDREHPQTPYHRWTGLVPFRATKHTIVGLDAREHAVVVHRVPGLGPWHQVREDVGQRALRHIGGNRDRIDGAIHPSRSSVAHVDNRCARGRPSYPPRVLAFSLVGFRERALGGDHLSPPPRMVGLCWNATQICQVEGVAILSSTNLLTWAWLAGNYCCILPAQVLDT